MNKALMKQLMELQNTMNNNEKLLQTDIKLASNQLDISGLVKNRILTKKTVIDIESKPLKNIRRLLKFIRSLRG